MLVSIQSTALFLTVLDVSKAYNSIIKQLLLAKIHKVIDKNLANQLLVFLLTVRSFVAGDITRTQLVMEKGLTQGGTSSPALFRVFINDLSKAVHASLSAHDKL